MELEKTVEHGGVHALPAVAILTLGAVKHSANYVDVKDRIKRSLQLRRDDFIGQQLLQMDNDFTRAKKDCDWTETREMVVGRVW
jgi:hypothetical protein